MKVKNSGYRSDNPRDREEAYYREFMKGFRIGRIQGTREVIIRILKRGRNNDRKLKRKINFETDIGFLDKVIFCLVEHINEEEKIKDFGKIYDAIRRSEEEIENEKHTTYRN
jgi:hypothetical protein